nr:MAG TPA: hypothetical protein [Caudoviricetes sp.]
MIDNYRIGEQISPLTKITRITRKQSCACFTLWEYLS